MPTYPVTIGEISPGEPILPSSLLAAQSAIASGDTIGIDLVQTPFASSQVTVGMDNPLLVGDVLRIEARGVWSTDAVGPTLNTLITGNGTTLAQTTALLHSPNQTNRGWWLSANITVIASGASGKLEVQGTRIRSTAANSAVVEDLENAAAISAIDLRSGLAFSIAELWNIASNSITMRTFTLERLRVAA